MLHKFFNTAAQITGAFFEQWDTVLNTKGQLFFSKDYITVYNSNYFGGYLRAFDTVKGGRLSRFNKNNFKAGSLCTNTFQVNSLF